ncbi:hypothetical protein P3T76_001752 [Phytophthora citrophthora]|uniref:Ubiquitin-protein ligase E3A N-terminal zinc-binding domain-containing protein n=1 Tax=Phytophthora citrophthora TaxID=4793 RepID=A0AAD9GW25_9STRA|nr:hypothetical protein P3T76_001752 [Phytophthora citrophthora]
MAPTSDYAYARQLVQAYFTMLTVGCQREDCTNVYCLSNFQRETLTTTEAAIKSIYFAVHAPVPLCFEFVLQHENNLVTAEPEDVKPDPEPQQAGEEDNQTQDTVDNLTDSIEEPQVTKEELHPETLEVETPTILQTEPFSVQTFSTDTSSSRKSTPRQRLSVAKQLDNGINKNQQLPVKRPTMVTRVVVQPKQKDPVESPPEDVSTPLEAVPQQPEHQQQSTKVSSPHKGAKRLISRPKEKLFDAIKRSFSWSKKAPLGR